LLTGCEITYDLDQLPRSQLPGLRDSILSLIVAYAEGPKPIRTALCVCLAILAIQMTEWKDVIQSVGAALGSNAGDCVLEFLQVLPEELYEGRKINLSVCRAALPSSNRHAMGPVHVRAIRV
jgi:transportin-3